MGKSSGTPPAAPDYASLIPLQEQSNLNQFNTMLGASRVNSVTPYGSSYWQRPVSQQYPSTAPQAGLRPLGTHSPSGGGSGSNSGVSSWAPAGPTGLPGFLNPPGASMGRGFADPMGLFGGGSGGNTSSYTPTAIPQGGDSGDPFASLSPAAGGQAPPDGMLGQSGFQPTYGGSANQDPWTLIQELNPGDQRLLDQARNRISNPVNFAGQLPGYQSLYQSSPGFSRDKAEEAIYNRNLRFMAPDYQQREQSLRDQLTSQGLNIGDEAYQRANTEFQSQRDRALADIRDQAIIGGGAEATAELGRGQSEQNRALQWALQNIGVQEQDRLRPTNEYNAFRTGAQMAPAQFNTPNLPNIDTLGLANQTWQNQLGLYNSQQASQANQQAGTMGMIGTLGGVALAIF